MLSCLVDPAVLSNPDDFKEEDVKKYKMSTFGGNHLRTAAKELNALGNLPTCMKKLEISCYSAHNNIKFKTIFRLIINQIKGKL